MAAITWPIMEAMVASRGYWPNGHWLLLTLAGMPLVVPVAAAMLLAIHTKATRWNDCPAYGDATHAILLGLWSLAAFLPLPMAAFFMASAFLVPRSSAGSGRDELMLVGALVVALSYLSVKATSASWRAVRATWKGYPTSVRSRPPEVSACVEWELGIWVLVAAALLRQNLTASEASPANLSFMAAPVVLIPLFSVLLKVSGRRLSQVLSPEAHNGLLRSRVVLGGLVMACVWAQLWFLPTP